MFVMYLCCENAFLVFMFASNTEDYLALKKEYRHFNEYI